MMHLKHVEKLKPSEIAKRLRVDVNDIYRAEKTIEGQLPKGQGGW